MKPFEVVDRLLRKIKLGRGTICHIVRRPEMEGEEEDMKTVLKDPDEIVESPKSKSVLIFNREYPDRALNERWLVVVVKILNKHGFILTSYRSNARKRGDLIWRRK